MLTRLFHKDGSESWRDPTYESRGEPIDARLVQWIHQVSGFHEEERYKLREYKWLGRDLDSVGDFITPMFFPPFLGVRTTEPLKTESGSVLTRPEILKKPRPTGAWGSVIPVRGVKSLMPSPFSYVLPVYDKTGVPDTRFDPIPEFMYTTPGDKKIAVGQWGLMCGLTKESGDIERVVIPYGDPLVAANNPSVDPKKSSIVYDLVPEKSDLSETDKAPLDSFWQVMQPFFSPTAITGAIGTGDSPSVIAALGFAPKPSDKSFPGLAWHIGSPPYSVYGHGMVVDRHSGSTQLGFVGKTFGGPLYIGDGRASEKHYLGETFDGEPEMSCHLDTNTMFKRDGGGFDFDAPLKFEEFYECDEPLPFVRRAHIRYDPCEDHRWMSEKREGYWKVQVEDDEDGSQKDCKEDEISEPTTDGGFIDPFIDGDEPGVGGVSLPDDGTTELGEAEEPEESESTTLTGGKEPPKPKEKSCYDLLDERRKTLSDPSIPKFDKWENKTGNFVGQESYRYTPIRKARSQILGKPTPSQFYDADIRDYTTLPVPAMLKYLKRYKREAPITSRRVFFGGQNGNGYIYTKHYKNPNARFGAGTGPGGDYLMPPEIDEADIRLSNENDAHIPEIVSNAVSPLYSGISPGGRLFFGYPYLDTGQIYSSANVYAWSFGMDTSNNFTLNQHVSGSATSQLTFPNTGADYFTFNKKVRSNDSFEIKNGSNVVRISPPTLTGDRVATLQDASGTIAYLSDIPSSTNYWDYASNYLETNVGVDTLAIENSAGDVAEITTDGITTGRTYDLPDASGTFKLKKNHFVYFHPVNNTTYQNQPARSVTPGGTYSGLQFQFPNDMATLIAVRVGFVPIATNASSNLDFVVYYGGLSGTALNSYTGTDTTSTYAATADQALYCDITSLFGSATAGMKGTVTITNQNGIGQTYHTFCVEIEYVPTA